MRGKIWLAALAAGCLLAGCGRTATVTELEIVPEPVFLVQKEGAFTLRGNPSVGLKNMGQNSPTVKYVMKSLRHAHLHPSMAAGTEGCDVALEVYDSPNPELGEEGYLIEVRTSGVRLGANTERGLFYAYQTFVQMLPPDVTRTTYGTIVLPECTVLDRPRFAWRGAQIDVCRHFFPTRAVKRYIDVLANYKMNRLQLHLSDDQGWRLPSEKYPMLNTVGSWRVDRSGTTWGEAHPAQEGERATYGGYYSREEVAELVSYAADRGVEIVPEVGLPGHCSALLAAYPQFSCDGARREVAIGPCDSAAGVLCLGNDSVMVMVKALLDEVMGLFPSRYIHVGGDWAMNEGWKNCPKCRRRMQAEHLHDEKELQLWLMRQVNEYLREHGRTMVGWDEVCDAGVGRDAVVAARRGLAEGLAAAREGNPAVMCPEEYYGLDVYQADPRYQPRAKEGMLTLAKVYEFDPVPMGTNNHVAANVLGGECLLWADHIETARQAEYMLLPRLLAVSEGLWSAREAKDWSRFRRKVEGQKDRLAAKGYGYCEGSFTPRFEARKVDDRTMNIAIGTEVPNTYIFYTTDLSTPTRHSPIYIGPVNLARGTHIKILPVYKGEERDSVYEFVIK